MEVDRHPEAVSLSLIAFFGQGRKEIEILDETKWQMFKNP